MRTNPRLRWLQVAIGFSLLALAGSALADDPSVPFEKYTLDNGLEVILHQDNSVPLVAVSVWYHVGSGDEVPGKSGFAHLFEHMMFQGSENTGKDVHFSILKQIGASSVNGTTNPNRTNYFEVVPSTHLETALWLESDRMGYMLPLLDKDSLKNQRDVVRNERRQRYDNVPYGRTRFAISTALYPEGHPYRYLTIGRHEDIEGASVKDVVDFFKTWYVPSNATIAIGGDIDIQETKKLVAKWFGSFPKSEKPNHQMVPAPIISQTKRIEISDPLAKLRQVHYAWHTPRLYAPGDAEFDILASALGRQGTGRLYRRLVLEEQLAQNVGVYQASMGFSSTFNVVVNLKPDASQERVEQIIDEEIEKIRSTKITKREFDRAVTNFESSYVWGLEAFIARIETLQSYNHFVGDPNWLTQDLNRYRNSSLAKVKQAAANYLNKNSRVEVITLPESNGSQK